MWWEVHWRLIVILVKNKKTNQNNNKKKPHLLSIAPLQLYTICINRGVRQCPPGSKPGGDLRAGVCCAQQVALIYVNEVPFSVLPANKEKCHLACLMRRDTPQSFCDCPMLAQWDPNVCLCRGKEEVFLKLSFSLLTFPQETRPMFSDFGKHQESPGRFVKTKIAGPKLQRLWFSSSGNKDQEFLFLTSS